MAGELTAAVQKRLGHEGIRTTVGVYGSMVSGVSVEDLTRFDAQMGVRTDSRRSFKCIVRVMNIALCVHCLVHILPISDASPRKNHPHLHPHTQNAHVASLEGDPS
jgi:hypothetical protein